MSTYRPIARQSTWNKDIGTVAVWSPMVAARVSHHMAGNEFDGTVEFSLTARLAPWTTPNDYVHTIKGSARDLDENVVGTVDLLLVNTTTAINQGQPLLLVCDSASALLSDIHTILFDEQGEPREEFDHIAPSWDNLLLVEDIQTQAAFDQTTLRLQLLQTGVVLFCPGGLAVAIEESLDLRMEEWKQLGFRRIAESPYVFLDCTTLNPYRSSATDGRYICDACGEEIVIPIDVSQGTQQTYVEDCPVCCRSNVIHVDIDEEGNAIVWAEPEQDYD